jgi:hypothetical protein
MLRMWGIIVEMNYLQPILIYLLLCGWMLSLLQHVNFRDYSGYKVYHQCVFTVCSLCVHCAFTVCSLCVHCVFTVCSLCVQCLIWLWDFWVDTIFLENGMSFLVHCQLQENISCRAITTFYARIYFSPFSPQSSVFLFENNMVHISPPRKQSHCSGFHSVWVFRNALDRPPFTMNAQSGFVGWTDIKQKLCTWDDYLSLYHLWKGTLPS